MSDNTKNCKEKIMEMVNAIQNPEYLYKIYHYIVVPYRMEMEKAGKEGEYDSKQERQQRACP